MPKPILDTKEKKQIIENLLKSSDFSKSDKYKKLLLYLSDATIKGETVKSSTLAFEFFGKEASYDPSMDSTVRSYISNLRKKLEHYYLTEGEDDQYKIVVPKGNYHIEFEKNTSMHSVPKREYLKYAYPIIIVLLLGLLAFTLFTKFSSSYKKNLSAFNIPLWESFFESKQKTLFVIGDYYVFKLNMDSERKSYVRDIEINSVEDLKLFIKDNPRYKNKIQETSNSYLDESIPFCLASIIPAFIMNDEEFEIKLSSDLQLEDLQNNNIIYIGSHKSMGLLNLFTRNLNFEYNILPGGVKFFEEERDTLFNYLIDDSFDPLARRDFPIVVKETGQNNNSFLFFLSIHDLGNISTIKYFTDAEKVKKLTENIGSENFVALFETRGYRREDFSIKLLHINKLPSKIEVPVK